MMRALSRLNKAVDKTPINGSYLKGTSKILTDNDYRIISRMCMAQLIEKSRRGELMDINSIISEYWFNEIRQLPLAELSVFVEQHGSMLENLGINPHEVSQMIKNLEKQHANGR